MTARQLHELGGTAAARPALEGATVSAAPQATTAAAALAFHPRFAEMLARSAFLQQANRLPLVPVPFVWLEEDGTRVHYLSRWDWPFNADGPRAMVLRESTSELVCASLPGRMWDIDPESVNADTFGMDELAHEAWKQQEHARPARGSRASASASDDAA